MANFNIILINIREKPNDKEWLELDKQKVPLLLNYSQCKLNEGDFYSVIEHCSTVLKSDPGLYIFDIKHSNL